VAGELTDFDRFAALVVEQELVGAQVVVVVVVLVVLVVVAAAAAGQFAAVSGFGLPYAWGCVFVGRRSDLALGPVGRIVVGDRAVVVVVERIVAVTLALGCRPVVGEGAQIVVPLVVPDCGTLSIGGRPVEGPVEAAGTAAGPRA